MVRPLLDPLQFAYQLRLGFEDAIIYLLNHVYAHLDKSDLPVKHRSTFSETHHRNHSCLWPSDFSSSLSVKVMD
ncbi:unnamed protein product [Merluccius merluccius]